MKRPPVIATGNRRTSKAAYRLPVKLRTPVDAPAAIQASTLTLTADELARELKVSVRTIRRMTERGELPAPVRIGGQLRWFRSVVIDWMTQGCPRVSRLEQQKMSVSRANEV